MQGKTRPIPSINNMNLSSSSEESKSDRQESFQISEELNKEALTQAGFMFQGDVDFISPANQK